MRHAPRAHPGPRQAGGGARPARAPAPARGAAADRARLGDAPAAGARRLGSPRRRPGPPRPRGARRAQRRPRAAHRAHPRPAGRRGHARGARCRPRPRRPRRDRPDAAGGHVERPARRGRRARDLRRRPGLHLPRRRDPGRARARRLPRALPRALDAGQRLVGVLRPRGEPLLGPPRRPALRRLHHAQRDGLPGGRRRLVARRPALRQGRLLRLRAPGARGLRRGDALAAGRWDAELGEYVLDWDDVIAAADPRAHALAFARSAFRHACLVCGWSPSSRPARRARRRRWSESADPAAHLRVP